MMGLKELRVGSNFLNFIDSFMEYSNHLKRNGVKEGMVEAFIYCLSISNPELCEGFRSMMYARNVNLTKTPLSQVLNEAKALYESRSAAPKESITKTSTAVDSGDSRIDALVKQLGVLAQKIGEAPAPRPRNSITCFSCVKTGHKFWQCHSKKPGRNERVAPKSVMGVLPEKKGAKFEDCLVCSGGKRYKRVRVDELLNQDVEMKPTERCCERRVTQRTKLQAESLRLP
jgi:hypothetical protein